MSSETSPEEKTRRTEWGSHKNTPLDMKDRKTGRCSVIIPCFNAEETLENTLESVLTQDYPDLEIIVIDDGSIDCTSDIIERYAEKDKRIIPVNIPNSGPSVARWKGLSLSSGEFIQFLDSDDYLLPGAIKSLMAIAKEQNADMVSLTFLISEITGERHTCRQVDTATLSGTEALSRNLNGGYWSLWSRLTRATLFEKVDDKGEGMIFGEDLIVSVQLLRNANRVAGCKHPSLVYHIRKGSLSADGRRSEKRRINMEHYTEWLHRYLTDQTLLPQLEKGWYGFKKSGLMLRISERWLDGIGKEFIEIGEAINRYPELADDIPATVLKLIKDYQRTPVLGFLKLHKYIRQGRI